VSAYWLKALISRLCLKISVLVKGMSFPGKLRHLSLSALSVMLLAVTVCLELAFTANLRIKFVDPDGKTLEKVEARITHLVTKRFEQELSNRQGQVEVAGLADGRYELLAQLRNFFPMKEEIELTGDVVVERVLFNQSFVDGANKEVAQAVEKGDYTRAAERLQQLLKLFPENASLHYNMAIVQAGLKDEEKATMAIDTAIRLSPDQNFQAKKKELQRDLLLELGQNALNERAFPKAASHYQKLTEIDPQNAAAFYGLALSFGHQRKYPEALAAIHRAIELAPAEQQYVKVKEMLEFNAKSR
jgi:tetratricopeptide (TPR) repeat protein